MKRIGILLIALGVAVGGAVGPANAMTVGKYYEFRYYSDEGHYNLIGVAGEYCDETTFSWGGISIYDEYQTWGC